jgi:hypothetical protein
LFRVSNSRVLVKLLKPREIAGNFLENSLGATIMQKDGKVNVSILFLLEGA